MDTTSPRAQTLALQGVVNRAMRGLLRAPGGCRLVGRRLLVLHVVGRTSGRRYSVPVAYTRHDGYLLVGTQFGWGRNLRTGSPVEIRLKGTRRQADVEAVADEAGRVLRDHVARQPLVREVQQHRPGRGRYPERCRSAPRLGGRSPSFPSPSNLMRQAP